MAPKTTDTATVEARVLVDLYRWHDEHGNPDSPVNEASKGDTVTVSQAEYDRAQEMKPVGLAKASDKTAPAASDPVEIPNDLSELSDKELLQLALQLRLDVDEKTSRDELVGAVAAAPGGYERPNQ